jgi:cytochrome c oxidase cbb3-type subunit I/II
MRTIQWLGALVAVGLGLTLPAGPVPWAADAEPAATPAPAANAEPASAAQTGKLPAVVLGRAVYLAECAACHGVRGDGRGPAAANFAQRPTDFTRGVYKLRSTLSSSPEGDLPTDADLVRTIRDGMSTTEMVPFRNVLSAESMLAVAQTVKAFSGRFADPGLPNPETIALKVGERPFPASESSAAAGKAVYESNKCADCHGERGEGNPDEKDKWGNPVRMVPFSLGYYKSGGTDQDLFRSIATGMRGTTMDFYKGSVGEQELWQLVDYVRSLTERPTNVVGRLIRYGFAVRPSGLVYRNAAPTGR